jgi:hypothetical protein
MYMDYNYGNDKFDIILLAGQSNAQGSGFGPCEEEYEKDGDILRMNGSRKYDNGWIVDFPFEISIEIPDSHGRDDLSLSFAHEYKKAGFLGEGRKILLVHTALGGTAFATGHWKVGDYLYKRMLYMLDCALNMNSENRLVTLLWHQGESDALNGNVGEEYNRQLSALFCAVRKRCEGNLPIITGDFVQTWKPRHPEECALIENQIKSVTDAFGGIFVNTEGLPSNHEVGAKDEDRIHFCRNSLHILGKRYFEAFKKIKEN